MAQYNVLHFKSGVVPKSNISLFSGCTWFLHEKTQEYRYNLNNKSYSLDNDRRSEMGSNTIQWIRTILTTDIL